MANWHFLQHHGFADINQSTSAEVFEGASLKGIATDLVRESIQNVLDARQDDGQPARVCMTLGVRPAAASVSSPWFDGLRDHLRQPDVGAPDAPKAADPCPFLVIKDFNTRGLVGDYLAPYRAGTENNFVNFLYHDGLTGKAEKKLGSRGVGKIVLLLASRARAIFANTNRHGRQSELTTSREPLK